MSSRTLLIPGHVYTVVKNSIHCFCVLSMDMSTCLKPGSIFLVLGYEECLHIADDVDVNVLNQLGTIILGPSGEVTTIGVSKGSTVNGIDEVRI